jgi:hypothetical protein
MVGGIGTSCERNPVESNFTEGDRETGVVPIVIMGWKLALNPAAVTVTVSFGSAL